MSATAFNERSPYRWMLEQAARQLDSARAQREFREAIDWFARWHATPRH